MKLKTKNQKLKTKKGPQPMLGALGVDVGSAL